jgi:hypothetical protein
MANIVKQRLLSELAQRFGELRKLPRSQSLFLIGNDAARVYLRYSRIHDRQRTFFGLREIDLRQLEGHNSFLCFLLDDGSPALFVPYSDFEEVFRGAEAATDGQYKVQLFLQPAARELYIARQGRFNVEGYVGFELLSQSLDSSRLRPIRDLSHAQVQTLLAGIGHVKGFDVYVPQTDAGNLDWTLTPSFCVRDDLPRRYEEVNHIMSEIDVIWIGPNHDEIRSKWSIQLQSIRDCSGLTTFY